jgi:2-polyprenyl-3-methyl-5-hydroxy-6-metoxy-1,4-benzoquinol methylase
VTTARYDAMAERYSDVVRDRLDDNAATVALLELVGDVHEARLLDLACGQGRIARALARRGASVLGVDISEELLGRAREIARDDGLGVEYASVDVTAETALAGERFDGVVCNFGLSDIDDLDAALAAVQRVLQPGGAFVFSILHPCFAGSGDNAPSSWPPDRSYYDEGWWQAQSTGFRGTVGSNHRTVATYLNALAAHELVPEQTVEPPPTEWPEPSPTGPVYLVSRSRRA